MCWSLDISAADETLEGPPNKFLTHYLFTELLLPPLNAEKCGQIFCLEMCREMLDLLMCYQ
jgi:hypothetical protein